MNRRDFLLKSSAAASLSLLARSALFSQPLPQPLPGNLGAGTGGPRPQPLPTGTGGPLPQAQPQGPGGPPMHPPIPVTEFHTLRRNVGYYVGHGGTIGWLASSSALVAVDTQFPDTAEIFLKGLPGRAERKCDAVINTHHHADHTGGNGIFKPVTKTIVAQAVVPELMLAAAKRSPIPTVPTLPTETFQDSWRREIGDEVIAARYFGPAHTSGDIVVHFEKANVVHMGDLVFNRIYPIIDRAAGGRFKNWLTALESMAKIYPADAIYIFGHSGQKFGVTGGREAILTFRDYIAALLVHVEKEIKAGKTKDEITKLDNLPGFPDLFVPLGPGNRFAGNLAIAYEELTNGKA